MIYSNFSNPLQVKSHPKENIFGISQDTNTKNYILVFEYNYFENVCCKQCGSKYTHEQYKWCKPCQINHLKKNFTTWTSGNKQIDDFIQRRQLEINYNNALFEWIPYNQFSNVKKINKSDSVTVYFAMWKRGPLYYDYHGKMTWMRKSDERVVLKCSYNLQSIDKLLNEVQYFCI